MRLEQNYPNPFNPVTTLTWHLPLASHVTLRVYDQLGNIVATLVDGEAEAGSHTSGFNAADLPSGVYIARLSARGHSVTRRMTLLR